MRMEIHYHNVETEKFNTLAQTYPSGRYDHSNGVYWFTLIVEGIEINWFKDGGIEE